MSIVRAAKIEAGVVTNVAKFRKVGDIPPGWVEAPGRVGKGFTHDRGVFTPPVVPTVKEFDEPGLVDDLIDELESRGGLFSGLRAAIEATRQARRDAFKAR